MAAATTDLSRSASRLAGSSKEPVDSGFALGHLLNETGAGRPLLSPWSALSWTFGSAGVTNGGRLTPRFVVFRFAMPMRMLARSETSILLGRDAARKELEQDRWLWSLRPRPRRRLRQQPLLPNRTMLPRKASKVQRMPPFPSQKVRTPPPAGAPPEPSAPVPPAQSWEGVSALGAGFRLEPAAEPPQRTGVGEEEEPYDAAMRLNSLRNLFSPLGLKNLNQTPETQERAGPAAVELAERPVGAPPYRPAVAPPAGNSGSSPTGTPKAAPALETAPLKIPAPPPLVEATPREHGWEQSSNLHRDRRDPVDEVEILPSWRGQYKKKK